MMDGLLARAYSTFFARWGGVQVTLLSYAGGWGDDGTKATTVTVGGAPLETRLETLSGFKS